MSANALLICPAQVAVSPWHTPCSPANESLAGFQHAILSKLFHLLDPCLPCVLMIDFGSCSGRAYVPLDPDYPPDRLAFTLEDSAADVLLTHRGFAARVPTKGMHVRLFTSFHLCSHGLFALLGFRSSRSFIVPHRLLETLVGPVASACPCCLIILHCRHNTHGLRVDSPFLI